MIDIQARALYPRNPGTSSLIIVHDNFVDYGCCCFFAYEVLKGSRQLILGSGLKLISKI